MNVKMEIEKLIELQTKKIIDRIENNMPCISEIEAISKLIDSYSKLID